MKLSRLSNRQLRRLLARGEVRFGDDKIEIKKCAKQIDDTANRMEAVFKSKNWREGAAFVRNNPNLKGLEYRIDRIVRSYWSSWGEMIRLRDELEKLIK